MIPTAQDVISQLGGKTIFTVLDQKDSYWQVPLTPETAKLFTFNTPFGWYNFQRMPFGICSVSEVLQKRNYQVFGDIPGVHIIADDMIIAAKTEQEHDAIPRKVMERVKASNICFNKDKMKFKVKEVVYMGNIVSEEGLKPDPQKVKVINEMTTPESKEDLRRILGMINYLAQFIPNLSAMTAPLLELLKNNVEWSWCPKHEAALRCLKDLLCGEPVLTFYCADKPVTVQCDAISYGLGACLLHEGRPIAYVSRSLTRAERNYAQIEKEPLAICFSMERFHHYYITQGNMAA